tara:strand:+ start:78008 stop:78604 length:597 start_codon:yes stop_codon:yes gene_type:complete
MKWVITGLDGSGKDTQIQNIINYGKSKNKTVLAYSIWDSLKLFSSIPQMEMKNTLDIFLTKTTPQARSLFLQSMLMESEKRIDFSAYDLVIFNAGLPKYAASEQTLGSPLSLWFAMETHFKYPDKTIYLKCSTDTVKQRKTNLSSYEKLFWDKLDVYKENLEHYVSQLENVVQINGDLEATKVFEQILVKARLFSDDV